LLLPSVCPQTQTLRRQSSIHRHVWTFASSRVTPQALAKGPSRLRRLAQSRYVSPVIFAAIYVGPGEKSRARPSAIPCCGRITSLRRRKGRNESFLCCPHPHTQHIVSNRQR
jgi:hypothetical protein